ncbi:MAG TPA: hypothetical protein VGO43_05900 [Pyrinomonadaceae bacterium]|jgi:hypothetical protein|nr:hypothetical protein [Pyrinomonadaceae bacterium]
MLRKIFQFAFISVVLCLSGQAFGQRGVVSSAQQISGDTFTVSVTTPKGARVYGVKRPSAAVLNAIDNGLTELFAVARKNRYRNRLNYSDYSVFIAKADRTKNGSGEYSPDIAVGAAQYAESVYDQGGFIYAAGMVISNDPAAFLIADHTKDLGRLSNVVRYEGEHLVLYHNDRRRYLETMDHSKGGSHPILQ